MQYVRYPAVAIFTFAVSVGISPIRFYAEIIACGPTGSSNTVNEGWVEFTVTKPDSKVDGDVHEKTDKAGRFTLKLLKALTGELVGEEWLLAGHYKTCPKVDEILAKKGSNNVTAQTNVVKLTTEQDIFEVELVLPFPRCEKAKTVSDHIVQTESSK
jgi:hypothetical protein